MIKLKGQLLIFDRVDKCGRKFAKDCKISFPDKAIVLDDCLIMATRRGLSNGQASITRRKAN